MESKIPEETVPAISISEECVQTINSRRILFAHMSVGNDILNGLALANSKLKEPIAMHYIETLSKLETKNPGISHFKIGANSQPFQKLSNFRQFLFSNNNGQSFDYVGLKFCYVDINNKTDIHALLNEYNALVKDVTQHYPHIKFFHFTVPLTSHYSSLKNRIKTMILGDQDNIKRNAFNELLRQTYSDKAIIDIALFESSYLDGSRMKHSYSKNIYYSLIPAYTTDGGHLNDLGKKKVAVSFAESICKALAD